MLSLVPLAFVFFHLLLADPRPALGQFCEGGLTNPMLITVTDSIYNSKVTKILGIKLRP